MTVKKRENKDQDQVTGRGKDSHAEAARREVTRTSLVPFRSAGQGTLALGAPYWVA